MQQWGQKWEWEGAWEPRSNMSRKGGKKKENWKSRSERKEGRAKPLCLKHGLYFKSLETGTFLGPFLCREHKPVERCFTRYQSVPAWHDYSVFLAWAQFVTEMQQNERKDWGTGNGTEIVPHSAYVGQESQWQYGWYNNWNRAWHRSGREQKEEM